MIYSITHRTRYEYSEPAALSQNDVCLSSRTTSHQTCESVDLNIFPVPSSLSERSDYFDNRIHQFMVQHPHNRLEIVTQSKVLTHPLLPPDASATPVLPEVLRLMDIHKDPATLEATEFMFPSAFIRPSTDFLNYAQTSFPPGRAVLEGAIELTSRIFNDFKYDKAATSVGTPIEKVFQDRKGVCQDFAHLQIACLRSLNLAARYVSGYLETLPPPGKEKLVGTDASHAWVSVFIPGLGWMDLDPTNNMIPGERHITVAWGRDYADVTPVRGIVWGGGTHTMNISVDVAPITQDKCR